MNGHGIAAPQAAQIVDIQMRPVYSFKVCPLPLPDSAPGALDYYGQTLTKLSSEGYQIVAQTATHLIMAKVVRAEKIAVDIGRVIVPVTSI